MKRFILLVSSLLVFFIVANAEPKNITILSIGDTHSCLTSGGERNENLVGSIGGIARAATVIKQFKMQDPDAILLHSGDFFIGDLIFNATLGVPELLMLKSLEIDALTLGNYEFDLTPMALSMTLGLAFEGGGFPVLCANAIIPDVSELALLKQIITPYTILERNGLKIGIFGMTTPEANLISLPQPIFIDTSIVEIATATVGELKSKGCDAIIFLSHLGFELDKVIANYVDGINLIIGGHTHLELTEPFVLQNIYGSQVPIIHMGAFYHNIAKTVLSIDKQNNSVQISDYELIPVNIEIEEEPIVKAMLDEIISGIEEEFGPVFTQPVGVVEQTFEETLEPSQIVNGGRMDTPVGNLVCDAFREWGKTDIAITAGGSTAQKLYKGPIVANDVYRMIGYGFNDVNRLGFRMVKIKVAGLALWEGIEFGLKDILTSDEFLIQTSGMKYYCDPTAEFGQKVKAIFINDEFIDPQKFYTVTTNEFIVAIMGLLGMPFEIIEASEDMTEFQVVLNYIISKQTLSPNYEPRIIAPVIETRTESNKLCIDKVYPNPCSGNLNVDISIKNPGFYLVSIYNVYSQRVMSYRKFIDSGFHKESIDTGILNSGFYTIEISDGMENIFSKFVIIK